MSKVVPQVTALHFNDPSKMDAGRTYSASTSTVTPLLARPEKVRSLPKAFDGFLRNSAYNPDDPVKGRVFDPKLAAYNTANTALVRRLKGRHLQMIAIGGSIGTFNGL
jgi:amino acid transporter